MSNPLASDPTSNRHAARTPLVSHASRTATGHEPSPATADPARGPYPPNRARVALAALAGLVALVLAGVAGAGEPQPASTLLNNIEAAAPVAAVRITGRQAVRKDNRACHASAASTALSYGLDDAWRSGKLHATCDSAGAATLWVAARTPSHVALNAATGEALRVDLRFPQHAHAMRPWVDLVSAARATSKRAAASAAPERPQPADDLELRARAAAHVPSTAVLFDQRKRGGVVTLHFQHQDQGLPVVGDLVTVELLAQTGVALRVDRRRFHQVKHIAKPLPTATLQQRVLRWRPKLAPRSLSCCRSAHDVTVSQRLGRSAIHAKVRCPLQPGALAVLPVSSTHAVPAQRFTCLPACQVDGSWRTCAASERVTYWARRDTGARIVPDREATLATGGAAMGLDEVRSAAQARFTAAARELLPGASVTLATEPTLAPKLKDGVWLVHGYVNVRVGLPMPTSALNAAVGALAP